MRKHFVGYFQTALAQVKHLPALHSVVESLRLFSAIGLRSRRAWPDGVAGRRGWKALPEGAAGRRGGKAWPYDGHEPDFIATLL